MCDERLDGLTFGNQSHIVKALAICYAFFMKTKNRSKKRNDFILFALILVMGAGVSLFNAALSQPGDTVVVTTGRDVQGVYALATDIEIMLEDGENRNVIVLADGMAKMTEANCANGDCLAARAIDKTGQSIVCLPNKVLINIEGAGDTEVDSVVY